MGNLLEVSGGVCAENLDSHCTALVFIFVNIRGASYTHQIQITQSFESDAHGFGECVLKLAHPT